MLRFLSKPSLRGRSTPPQRGSLLVIAILVAAALSIFVVAVSRLFNQAVRESVHFDSADLTCRMAEDGLYDAVGKIAVSPKIFEMDEFQIPTEIPPRNPPYILDRGLGVQTYVPVSPLYWHHYAEHSKLVQGGYFIYSVGVDGRQEKSQSCGAYAHVAISNAGEYFFAVKRNLTLARGTNASQGKIYADNLRFNQEGADGVITKVKEALYVTQVTPSPPGLPYCQPGTCNGTTSFVEISTKNAGLPERLDVQLMFPQVLDADMIRFGEIAADHRECNFTGEIFPPGYSGSKDGRDPYSGHTFDNAHHVYYCSNPPMKIQGTIHGQVLFVSAGDIWITGNLVNSTDGFFPGNAGALKSEAHQAVLITQHDVLISSSAAINAIASGGTPYEESIHAMIMAPMGRVYAQNYSPYNPSQPDTHPIEDNLSLSFEGSIICQEMISGAPNAFGWVFSDVRSYTYMTSLLSHPPPYLPGMADIRFYFEKPNLASLY